ncbi:MAG: YegS/Rv2252/BmrU family lipid kinase [Selenomonadaceae bacterium]|nr:YegS/Rv2252/BmrU family lipid kinase [Selenomonadaceae bacterium]MBR1858397.1 YegS/Rv2252/BmrU family lipid kinase [Selenomonadaceae bacterium]
MKKILLVYNPVSGHAAFKSKLDSIVESFQRRNILLSMYRTRQGDNSDFEECVNTSHADGIIAAGGDGTLHAVVNWIMKSKIDLPIGIIGSGTSNDFATYLGINDNLDHYFDRILLNQTRKVDVGVVNDEEYFINVASAGVLTSIAHEVNVKLKNALGKLAYYIQGIGEIPKFKAVTIRVDANGVNFEFEAFLFIVLNSGTVAGMKKVADFAEIDDGKLDLLAVKKCSPSSLIKLTRDLFSGKGVQSDAENVFHMQSKEFYISSLDDLTSDIDGEVGSPLPIKIDTIPQALNFFI